MMRWDKCLILMWELERMFVDGEECGVMRWVKERAYDHRKEVKGQEWNMWEREFGIVGHHGQKPEWGEMLDILIPIGRAWCAIFHKRSWVLWG